MGKAKAEVKLPGIVQLIPFPAIPSQQAKHYPKVGTWLIHQVFGGTGFLSCAGIFAQPGMAVPPVRKTCG
jgi:hypothetical protein